MIKIDIDNTNTSHWVVCNTPSHIFMTFFWRVVLPLCPPLPLPPTSFFQEYPHPHLSSPFPQPCSVFPLLPLFFRLLMCAKNVCNNQSLSFWPTMCVDKCLSSVSVCFNHSLFLSVIIYLTCYFLLCRPCHQERLSNHSCPRSYSTGMGAFQKKLWTFRYLLLHKMWHGGKGLSVCMFVCIHVDVHVYAFRWQNRRRGFVCVLCVCVCVASVFW